MLRPQHRGSPELGRAQVCQAPAATWKAMVPPRFTAGAGRGEGGHIAQAELSGLVAAPALEDARAQQGAGVLGARGELEGHASRVHASRGSRCLVVADGVGMAIAELAIRIAAPAAHGPRGEPGTGVLAGALGGELRHGAAHADIARAGR